MAEILTTVGTFVTSAVTWIGQFAGAITSNPPVMVLFCMAIAGVGIGFLRRLFKTV